VAGDWAVSEGAGVAGGEGGVAAVREGDGAAAEGAGWAAWGAAEEAGLKPWAEAGSGMALGSGPDQWLVPHRTPAGMS